MFHGKLIFRFGTIQKVLRVLSGSILWCSRSPKDVMFSVMFACLMAGLQKNSLMDFYETGWEDVKWTSLCLDTALAKEADVGTFLFL